MATKKYQMSEKLSATEILIIHPETTASQVIEETDRKFMTDAERAKLQGLNNYTHPTGFTDKPAAVLNGAAVISKIEVTPEGHVEDVTTRNLTPSDIGAEPTIPTGTGTQYIAGDKSLKTMPTSLPANGGNADTVDNKHASDFILASLKGANNGVAELDSTGKVPSAQLPSYVDDVIEITYTSGSLTVTNLALTPATVGALYYSTTQKKIYRCTATTETSSTWTDYGLETGKIYVNTETNVTYRYSSGVGLVEISPSIALGETSSTAYRGDRGKTAYDHSQSTGNPHGSTPEDIGAEPAFTKNTAFNKSFESTAANIKMDGTASAGSSANVARADHVHPTDTTREPVITKKTAFNQDFESSAANLKANGTAAVGSSNNVPRADHVHPTDTTRAPLASPTFTGDPKAPTPATTDNDTSIATTAFVKNVVGAAGNTYLPDSGVPAGSYSAVTVNGKGIVTAGAQMIEIGATGQTTPSASLAIGGLFFKEVG